MEQDFIEPIAKDFRQQQTFFSRLILKEYIKEIMGEILNDEDDMNTYPEIKINMKQKRRRSTKAEKKSNIIQSSIQSSNQSSNQSSKCTHSKDHHELEPALITNQYTSSNFNKSVLKPLCMVIPRLQLSLNSSSASLDITKKNQSGKLFVKEEPLSIRTHDHKEEQYRYDIQNVFGYKVCFNALISLNDHEYYDYNDYNVNDVNVHSNELFSPNHSLIMNSKQILISLPVELFYGKREAESVELIINDCYTNIITVTLQKDFQQYLYNLTTSSGNIVMSSLFGYRFPICDEMQHYMYFCNHLQYVTSLSAHIKNLEIKDRTSFNSDHLFLCLR